MVQAEVISLIQFILINKLKLNQMSSFEKK